MTLLRSARGAAVVAAGVALSLVALAGPARAGQAQPGRPQPGRPQPGQPQPGQPQPGQAQPVPMSPGDAPPANAPTAPPTVAPLATDNLPLPPPILRGQTVSVLAYDFTSVAMGPVAGDLVAKTVMNTIKGGMIFSQKYDVATFSPRLPLLKKANLDGIVTSEDTNGLYDPTTGLLDTARALRVARLLRVQSILTGTIEDIQVNRDGNSASVTANVQLLNSVTGEPVVPAVLVSGSATGTEETSTLELALLAARDAGFRALAEFGIGAGVEEGKNGAAAVVGLPDKIGSAPTGSFGDEHAGESWFERHGVPPWVGLAVYMGALLSPAAFRHTPMHHLP